MSETPHTPAQVPTTRVVTGINQEGLPTVEVPTAALMCACGHRGFIHRKSDGSCSIGSCACHSFTPLTDEQRRVLGLRDEMKMVPRGEVSLSSADIQVLCTALFFAAFIMGIVFEWWFKIR